jgi:phosphoenolpyruvate phosphomutase
MAADDLDEGHIEAICEARKLGDVVVGLLTDQALASCARVASHPYEQRKRMVENRVGAVSIVPQDTPDCTENLRRFRPRYVMPDDDWDSGPIPGFRERVVSTIRQWGGELVERPVSRRWRRSGAVKPADAAPAQTPRSGRLRSHFQHKKFGRLMEVHNGLTGLIVEQARVDNAGAVLEYDGMWLSSLTHSASKGKPDIGYVDITALVQTIMDVLDVTSKPLMIDGDTGGPAEHLALTVRALERIGVSALAIEDKVGLKRNSLFGTSAAQRQDSTENFAAKISAAKQAQLSAGFMVVARIESLVLRRGADDALRRAEAYVGAGADAILIHSIADDPAEVLGFSRAFRDLLPGTPLIAVPTTYSTVTEQELADAGVTLVIYGNHLMRSAYPAMCKTAEAILRHGRSLEVESGCMPAADLARLIEGVG